MLKLKFKTLLTPIALSIALAVTIPALAQKHHGHKRDGMRQLLSQLSLTDTQKQDIKTIMQQSRADGELLAEDNMAFRTEIRTLVQSDEWDETAVEEAFTEHQSTFSEKMLQRASSKNQVWNVLTDEQQVELAANIAEKQAEREALEADGEGKKKRKRNPLKKLALTDEQKTEVEAIREQSKEERETIKAKLKEFKQAEIDLVNSSEFSEEAWQELSTEYQTNFLAMAVLKAKTRHEIWNVLTEEQQQKFAARMEKMLGKKKRSKKQESA